MLYIITSLDQTLFHTLTFNNIFFNSFVLLFLVEIAQILPNMYLKGYHFPLKGLYFSFYFHHILSLKIMSQIALLSYVRIWVYEFHPKFLFFYNFFITKIFQHNFFFFFSPFSFFTSNFVHHKTPWPLRPHFVQYPPGSLEQFSSPGFPSAVHDQVCSLKRSALCSASPALINDMTGSNIFYCVLNTCDSVCEFFWHNIN